MRWLQSTGLRLILAVGLGFMLWVFVSFSRNPDRTAPFDNTPVNLQRLSPGLISVDEEGLPRNGRPSVRVIVEAPDEVVRSLQPSDLHAYVDLSGRGRGQHVVPVNVETTRTDISGLHFSKEPDFLSIRLDQEITRTIPLTIEVLGNVPFSYEEGSAQATLNKQPVEEVQVRGPQNRVERVVVVRATANISGFTANYDSSRLLIPIGEDGQEIEGVTIVPDELVVRVPISSSVGIKRVPVVPRVVGLPASGYIVTSVAVEPQFVSLTGSSRPLEPIQSIMTLPVNVEGRSETFSTTIALDLPSATTLRAEEPDEALVTVQITPLNQSFQVTLPVPVQLTGEGGGLLISYSPQVVRVTLAGTAAQLAALDPATIQANVNVRGFGPGTYAVVPVFTLPPGVTVVGDPPRVSVAIQLPPSPTPLPTATPQVTATTTVQETPTPAPTTPPTTEPAPTGAAAPTEPADAVTPTTAPTPTAPAPAPEPAPTITTTESTSGMTRQRRTRM